MHSLGTYCQGSSRASSRKHGMSDDRARGLSHDATGDARGPLDCRAGAAPPDPPDHAAQPSSDPRNHSGDRSSDPAQHRKEPRVSRVVPHHSPPHPPPSPPPLISSSTPPSSHHRSNPPPCPPPPPQPYTLTRDRA